MELSGLLCEAIDSDERKVDETRVCNGLCLWSCWKIKFLGDEMRLNLRGLKLQKKTIRSMI
jgi:hypothetical protein